MPKISIKAMKEFLVSYSEMGPDSPESEIFIKELWDKTRGAVSKLVKCRPEEIVITQSVTDGINIVANGMNFRENSNIIIRGAEHEHHANYFPWLRLGEKLDVKNLPIDENGGFTHSELRNLIDENINSDEILAKVLIDRESPFLKSIILNKGTKDNVKMGMAIIDGVYLVGQIIEVNYTNSRALLLSDLNSKIPSVLAPQNIQAVVSGTGKDYGIIEHTNLLPKEKYNNAKDNNVGVLKL